MTTLTYDPVAVSSTPEALSALREGSPAKLRRRLGGDLDTITLRALQKEPQRRYVSVEQFAEDIRRHLEGQPVTARRDAWAYRVGKFAMRHKLGVIASALVLFAVLGGVVATVREARIAAANERNAEERFSDVRKLANSLMFEIHDSIVDLPGATPARKLIVQRSLEYLDGLSQEASGDVSLQRELANAYERIGLVQGDPNGSNLGDIAGANDSFAKALSIREKVAKSAAVNSPADTIAVAVSYREMCAIKARYLGNIGSALADCGKAVGKSEELRDADPSNRLVQIELAKDYETTGNVLGQSSTNGNAGDSFAALENHRKALNIVQELVLADPGNTDLSSWQGSLSLLTADDLFETGHVAQAVPLYSQAMKTLEDLTKKSNKTSYQDSLMLAYQRMGDMLLVAGHSEQAMAYYQKQLELNQQMLTADPKSMAFRTSLIASKATYGHAVWRSGRVEEGLALLRAALAEFAESKQSDSRASGLDATLRLWIAGALEKKGDKVAALKTYLPIEEYFARICESDPKDLEDCLSLAGTQDRIASLHLQQGHLEASLQKYQTALTISEPSTRGGKPNLEAIYTIVNLYYGLGEVNSALAHAAVSGARHDQLQKEACDSYRKSYAAFLRIPEWLPITPNEFDSKNLKLIKAGLSSCPAAAESASR